MKHQPNKLATRANRFIFRHFARFTLKALFAGVALSAVTAALVRSTFELYLHDWEAMQRVMLLSVGRTYLVICACIIFALLPFTRRPRYYLMALWAAWMLTFYIVVVFDRA